LTVIQFFCYNISAIIKYLNQNKILFLLLNN
jgi:hypothetical protein